MVARREVYCVAYLRRPSIFFRAREFVQRCGGGRRGREHKSDSSLSLAAVISKGEDALKMARKSTKWLPNSQKWCQDTISKLFSGAFFVPYW